MALARARAIRSLQSSLRPRAQPLASRLAAPGRTQLIQRRYASGGGDGAHGEAGSDIPWMIGAIAVTIPSCWYLWPDSSHAEHSGGHGHDEHGEGEEGGEEEGGEEKAAEGGEQEEGGEEKSSEDDSKGGDEEKPSSDDGEEKKDDSEAQDDTSSKDDSKPNKNDSKQGQDSSAPDFDKTPADAPPTEEQETSPGGGGGKDDETVTKDGPKDRKVKKKPDSGQTIGFTKDEEGQDKKESGAKHSLPIQSDPGKSKKGEGSPETAKMHGTVDPSRPQK